MADIGQARKALVARVLEGDGEASRVQRRAAFDNAEVAEPSRALIQTVAAHPSKVSDQHIDAARSSGMSEDQVFEIVVCAAIGQATRQVDAALAALEAATAGEG